MEKRCKGEEKNVRHLARTVLCSMLIYNSILPLRQNHNQRVAVNINTKVRSGGFPVTEIVD